MSRRRFLQKTGAATAAIAGTGLFHLGSTAANQTTPILIVLDPTPNSPLPEPVTWAVDVLVRNLQEFGCEVRVTSDLKQAPRSDHTILVGAPGSMNAIPILAAAGAGIPAAPESLALVRGKIEDQPVLVAAGSDVRGVAFAVLELADRIKHSSEPLAVIRNLKPVCEQAANPVRSAARAFVSNVEDNPWFRDKGFWREYLSMLATHRFNRFNLTFGLDYDFTTDIRDCYFHFAYPFLLAVPGYNVRAMPLPDSERDQNLDMLRFIGAETVRRGMQFQLGLWTHAYRWTQSPNANYTIEGLTPETQANYCRDALQLLLQSCTSIGGVTIRTHGESGVPEGQYGFWQTIFDGIIRCGRQVEIDLHAKGIDQEMIDVALATGMPVTVSPKFWAEHMGLPYMQGSIRASEMPPETGGDSGFFAKSTGSRRFTRYGYADLLAEDRRYKVLHRLWPGTQRFLLWRDPETASAYSRVSGLCGSVGMEWFEPLFFKGRKGSGRPGRRDAYAQSPLQPSGPDWWKYEDTYRLWGRCLYNPSGDPEALRRRWRTQLGKGSDAAEAALASASRILPLVTTAHAPSVANNIYWPEIYTNMPIVNANRPHPYDDMPLPRIFGTVSPLDPEFFTGINAFADELVGNAPSGKYSPAWVASRLEENVHLALSNIHAARSSATQGADLDRLTVDVVILAGLGRFFAAKFRAASLYALFERTGHRPALEHAARIHRIAEDEWSTLASVGKDIYVHDITWGYDAFQRGHWTDRLAAIQQDTKDLGDLLNQKPLHQESPTGSESKRFDELVTTILNSARDEAPGMTDMHRPPEVFVPGKSLSITAQPGKPAGRFGIKAIQLRYRHLNQGERWQVTEMTGAAPEFRGQIPADYTRSRFPLQYYFQIHGASGNVWLRPGLDHTWKDQPYYVVRQERHAGGVSG